MRPVLAKFVSFENFAAPTSPQRTTKVFFPSPKKAVFGLFLGCFLDFSTLSRNFFDLKLFSRKVLAISDPQKKFQKNRPKTFLLLDPKRLKKLSLECSQSGGCVLLAGCGFFLRIFKINSSPSEDAPIHLEKKTGKVPKSCQVSYLFYRK